MKLSRADIDHQAEQYYAYYIKIAMRHHPALDPEDVVQQAFADVLQRLDRIPVPATEDRRIWARNVIHKTVQFSGTKLYRKELQFRGKGTHGNLKFSMIEPEEVWNRPGEERDSTLVDMVAVVDSIEDPLQQLVIAERLLGYSYKETSERFDVKIHDLKHAMREVKDLLRRKD